MPDLQKAKAVSTRWVEWTGAGRGAPARTSRYRCLPLPHADRKSPRHRRAQGPYRNASKISPLYREQTGIVPGLHIRRRVA
jgi:hypothetical protein